MFQLSSPGKPLIAAAVIFWGVFSATAANAITIFPQNLPGISQQDPVVIDTNGAVVEGLLAPNWPAGPVSTSLTQATGFELATGSNPDAEAALMTTIVNFVANPDVTFTAPGAKIENPGDDVAIPASWEYFSIKKDGWIAFFHNVNGVALDLDFSGLNGASTDISHTTRLAGPLVPGLFNVPGPAVGAGLPGLIAACGGLLAFARRRRKKLA